MNCAFFVCQAGPLELKSRILAASLRHFSKAPLTIRAFVPAGFDSISANTIDFFKKYSVDVSAFEPVTARAFDYLIGNKIDAACERFDTERAILMDTDIFAQAEFDLGETRQGQIFAVPVSSQTVFGRKKATRFSRFLKGYNPNARVTISRAASGALVVTAFNSGFVSFEVGGDFPHSWRRMIGDIMQSDVIRPLEKRPYADQLALAFIYALDNSGFVVGDFRWNASINRQATTANFCHYHNLSNLFLYEHALETLEALDQESRKLGARMLGEVSLKDFSVGPLKKKALRMGRLVAP